jgi:anti-sigma regulatory factor (Ser/Thr protein kinase)
MSTTTVRLRISSESDTTQALIAASRAAEELGFSKQDCQAISTAVSELARNILKYAGEGEILIDRIETDRKAGLQVTARDRGPGIEDVATAMQDHFSSSGTLGLGLPGVKRLMDDFEIDSAKGKGTRVTIRKWRVGRPTRIRSILLDAARRASLHEGQASIDRADPQRTAAADVPIDYGSFIRPCRGERVSGDITVFRETDTQLFVAVVDALGHGPSAHAIATQAARFLEDSWSSDLGRTMRELHEALRGTDGAAAGLCLVDIGRRSVRYVGVGNTVARTLTGAGKSLYSPPGTLGHQIRTPREQTMTLATDDVLVLYTDGVKEQFEVAHYRQLLSQDARTIARTIVTRHGKDHDDATCAVVRYSS